MNLRNNKGYVITDVSISIIILLVLVPVIMGIVYQIGTTKRATDAKSEAINIITNAIETAKGISLDQLSESAILNELDPTHDLYESMDINEDNSKAVITTENGSYQLTLNVVDYKDEREKLGYEDYQENIVKTVTATVNFRLKGTDKEINLRTVIK